MKEVGVNRHSAWVVPSRALSHCHQVERCGDVASIAEAVAHAGRNVDPGRWCVEKPGGLPFALGMDSPATGLDNDQRCRCRVGGDANGGLQDQSRGLKPGGSLL